MKREGSSREVICGNCGGTEFKVFFPTDPYEVDLERSHRLGLAVRLICTNCGREITFAPLRNTQIEISIGASLREKTTITEGVNHGKAESQA